MSSGLRRRKQGAAADAAVTDVPSAPAPASTSTSPPSRQGKAVVVGGGPAGALAAKVLSDRGYDVTLYEAYPHPSGYAGETSKSYVISLGPRGLRALRRCGVLDPLSDLDGAVACTAAAGHGPPGTRARIRDMGGGEAEDREEPPVAIRRRELAASLLRIAEKAGVKVRCGHRMAGIDFDGRVAAFTKAEGGGEEVTAPYDLLVGADGVRSKTRELLAEHCCRGRHEPKPDDGGFRVVGTEDDTTEYQVAVLPPWRDLLVDAAKGPGGGSGLDTVPTASLHSWNDRSANSMGFGFPLPDGRTLICVVFPGGRLGQMKEESCKGGEDGYGAPLSALFDDWTPAARSNLAAQLADDGNVPSTGGTCVWTSSLCHPPSGVVLVGDSGHAMWPSLGQGCNCALESASVLADAAEAVLGDAGGTLVPSAGAGVRALSDASNISAGERASRIAEEYQGLRHDDALAAVDLTHGGIGGRGSRGSGNAAILFKAQVMLFLALNAVTLGLVPKPAVFRVMAGDDARYSTLKWQADCERAAVYGMLVLVALGAVRILIWAMPS